MNKKRMFNIIMFSSLMTIIYSSNIYGSGSGIIYTPEGREVNGILFDANDFCGCVGPCSPSPCYDYYYGHFILFYGCICSNCHGYTWSQSEGGPPFVIISQSADLDNFWTDNAWSNDGNPSYIELEGTDTVEATHIVYFNSAGIPKHSARKIQNSWPKEINPNYPNLKYVSSWDGEGLFQHTFTGHRFWTSNTYVRYFKLKTNHGGTLKAYPGYTTTYKTWIGAGGITHTVSSTITVPQDVVLTIQPGATVEITGNAYIYIYGKIIAKGTAAQPITFKKNGLRWKKMLLYSDDNEFEYCTFDGADYSVELNGSTNNTFKHCTFKNAYSRAVSIFNSSQADIEGCEFFGNRYALYIQNYNDVDLTGNQIHDNIYGIYSASNNFIKGCGNVIENNTSYGLITYYGDVVHLGYGFEWTGKNTIRNNGGYNLYKSYGSPVLELQGASIHTPNGYEIYNYSSPTIYAVLCWYGGGAPNKGGSGGLNNYVMLTSQPSWEGIPQDDCGTMYKSSNLTADNVPAKYQGYQGIQSLKSKIMDNSVSDIDKMQVLKDLYSLLRSDFRENYYNERDHFESFIENDVLTNTKGELAALAIQYEARWCALQGKYNKATHLFEELLENKNDKNKMEYMISLVSLYKLNGQKNKAGQILDTIISEVGDDNELIAGLQADINAENKPVKTKRKVDLPDKFLLAQNYPNPFNPKTRIQFDLPEDADVILSVFDIKGQKVTDLVNGFKNAGSYQIEFDGSNLASGVYFYRINAGSFVQVRRMLLIK